MKVASKYQTMLITVDDIKSVFTNKSMRTINSCWISFQCKENYICIRDMIMSCLPV